MHRSATVISLLAGISGILVSGCTGERPESMEGFKRYVDEARGFSIEFPDEWQIVKGDGVETPFITGVSAWEDDADEFSELVSVDVEELEERLSLEDYFEQTCEHQLLEFSYFERIDSGETPIDGIEAKYILFDIGPEDQRNRVRGYALVRGKRGYLISCIAEASKYDEYGVLFEKIVCSFRFE